MANKSRMNERQILSKNHKGIEEMWLEVLERIQVTGLREFLYKEGKLISVNFGAAPTVQLMFSSQMTKSTAEKLTELSGVGVGVARAHPRGEIIEEAASPVENKNDAQQVDAHATSYRSVEGSSIGQASASQRNPIVKSHLDCRKLRKQGQSKSIVKSKVSLAHVIQQAESQRSGMVACLESPLAWETGTKIKELTLLESIKSNPSEAVPLENSNLKTKSIAEVSLMWEMSLFKISKIVLGISQRIHPTAIKM
ncbi:Protein STICHEL-like [Arachis hypogaea]|nr:Protein STICHEL-like [Arachis hypogaea]